MNVSRTGYLYYFILEIKKQLKQIVLHHDTVSPHSVMITTRYARSAGKLLSTFSTDLVLFNNYEEIT